MLSSLTPDIKNKHPPADLHRRRLGYEPKLTLCAGHQPSRREGGGTVTAGKSTQNGMSSAGPAATFCGLGRLCFTGAALTAEAGTYRLTTAETLPALVV
jgi:hypothetical protein